MNASSSLTILMATVLLSSGCSRQKPEQADRIFLNGAVYTLDEQQPWAEAVAVRDGEIVFVGSDEDVADHSGDATVIVDLKARMLMPAFHDSHAHVLAGGLSLEGCNLNDERDLDAIRAMLRSCAEDGGGAGDWVIGSRWALAAFPNGSPPMQWLDEIFAGRPAYFVDSFAHSAWVSSRALQIPGIDKSTPDPPQGVIERDPVTGEPTGTLRDSAMELVAAHLPEPSNEELSAGLERGLEVASRFGITAYIEPGLATREVTVYRIAEDEGRLRARVLASLSPLGWGAGRIDDEDMALFARHDDFSGMLFRADSVKIYIDGVIETRTSHMLDPYDDGSNFKPFYAPSELNELYRRLDALQLQIHTHAIGDGAIRIALDAYEYARNENGPSDNRHHIAHLQLIDEGDIPRFAELDVAANFQGLWAYPDDYIDVATPIVGAERVSRFYPVASVLRAGGTIIGGSDWDVSSLNPLDAIETLVRRQNPYADGGPVLGTDEEIGLEAALRAYTSAPARIMRLENDSGSIEVGKRADLIVLDRNLFDIPATAINEAEVVLTLLDGKTIFQSPEFQGRSSLQVFQALRPVGLQQPRQRAIRQQSTAGLAASAVIGLIFGIDDALDR